jgi:hypothetical protein
MLSSIWRIGILGLPRVQGGLEKAEREDRGAYPRASLLPRSPLSRRTSSVAFPSPIVRFRRWPDPPHDLGPRVQVRLGSGGGAEWQVRGGLPRPLGEPALPIPPLVLHLDEDIAALRDLAGGLASAPTARSIGAGA